MNTTVGTVLIDVKADTAKFVSGMQKAESTVKKSVDNIKKTIVSMAAAYAGIEGIKAFSSMIQDSIDAADATGELAQKFGLATEAMSEYQYAATMVGVSSGELNAGLGALIRRLKNFQENGGGAAKDAFSELGISMEYARKNFTTTDKAFVEILKRLEEMPEGYRKTAVAQDIFSKSASGILKLTASDLEKFSREARAIGISVSQSVADMAGSYNDSIERLDYRIRGIKNSVAFGVVGPMDAASKSIVAMFDESFGSTADKMKYFESVAIETIDSVAYGFGFIKDSITGIKIVITSLEIAFYGAAVVIAGAFEPIRHEINALIEGYNSLADLVGSEKIDIRLESSIPDNIEKIKELKKEVIEYTQHIEDGRNSAEELSRRMRKNLANSEEKTGAQRRRNDNAGFDIYDDGKNSKLKQQQEQLLKQQEQTYRDYLAIVGNEYDNWLLDVSDKMKKLAADGSLSAEQLNAAWSQLNKEYEINLSINGLDEIESKYQDMIDAQIALSQTGLDWGNSLSGVAKDIANSMKGIQKLYIGNLKFEKEQHKLTTQFGKDWLKIESKKIPEIQKVQEQKELQADFDKNYSKLKDEQFSAEMAGWSSLAGAMSGAYEQGSSGAIAFAAVQSALGIASSWTAIANAWAQPFPANLAVAPMVMSAVMPIIGQLSGGSGGGGSVSVDVPNNLEVEQSNFDQYYDAILGKFDRQIQLLESLNKLGTSSSLGVVRAGYEFDRAEGQIYLDLKQSILDTLKDVDSSTAQMAYNAFVEPYFNKNFDAVEYFNGKEKIFVSNMWDSIFHFSSLVEEGSATYNELLGEFQQAIIDFSTGIIESVSDLRDASVEFGSYYDEITGTSKYSGLEFTTAYNDISSLIGDKSLDAYLEEQIANIATLDSLLSAEDINLLLSQDPADMQAQIDLNEKMAEELGVVFANGAEEALNYKDQIAIVSEALAASRENIKEFEDMFKTEEEKLNDLKSLAKYDGPIATTEDELFSMFDTLKGGIDGLTDSELDFLNANKDLIDSLDEAQQSLNDWADSVFDNQELSSLSAQFSISALNSAIAAYATAEDKSAAADNIIQYANDAIDYTKNTSTSLADYNYKSAVIANSVRDIEQIDTGSFKSVEDAINEQTVILSSLLDEIKDNTEKTTVEMI